LDQPSSLSQDEVNLDLVEELQTASFSRVPKTILNSVSEFNENYKADGSLELARIAIFYTDYAKGLEQNLSPRELQGVVSKHMEAGNWFEKYIALEHSSYLHGTNQERQAALQKAQLALSIIPESSHCTFAQFAR